VTRAWTPPGRPPDDTGLSRVATDSGSVALAELLAARPDEMVGPGLVERAGVTTGLLVKLLDAAIRLPVHAHPTRSFARSHLGSWFGKAEAWIVIGTRELPGEEPPHVRLGFRQEVERAELLRLVERGGRGIAEQLRVRPVHPGDAWFVPAGVPHAIGAGVFLVEVQEPSDFSIVAETAGFPIDPALAHLGLGWQLMIDAFDRRGWSDEALERLHRFVPPGQSGRHQLLVPDAEPFFRAERFVTDQTTTTDLDASFVVVVVVAGRGRLRAADATVDVRTGDTIGVPAVLAPNLVLDPDEVLEVIACRPPLPDLLEATGG
jgi:mannose-6-phosphate isomerase